MPTYQYACTQCHEQLEAVQSFSDPALTECPACGGRLRKVYSAVGVVFKGSGFYKTDSRAANGKGGGKGKADGEGSSSGKADAGSSGSSSSTGSGSDNGSSSAAPATSSSSSSSGSGSSSGTPASSGAKTS